MKNYCGGDNVLLVLIFFSITTCGNCGMSDKSLMVT